MLNSLSCLYANVRLAIDLLDWTYHFKTAYFSTRFLKGICEVRLQFILTF